VFCVGRFRKIRSEKEIGEALGKTSINWVFRKLLETLIIDAN